ncbi:hypothetical protein BGZ82_010241 [Podila clonocystis]|nr:hypothetical protein BGZ82_010241 [Podila clonocystis]
MSTAVLPSSHFKFLHESDLPVVPLPDRWHSGERLFQDRVQVREAIQGASAIFRPFLTPQHQDFVLGLNYIFVGSLDKHGRPWVSMVCGPKGFMTSPDIKTLEIRTRISNTTSDGKEEEKDRARVLDPILDNLLHGESFRQGKKMWSAVALDFTNRRRNKFNGVVYPEDILKADPTTGEMHVRLTVEQSIGNCPKYITIREMAPLEPLVSSSTSSPQELFHYGTTNTTFQGLSDFEQGIVRRADCLFIASRYIDESLADQTSGMDCNHRGGNPGWIRVDDEGKSIVFPDYSGNRFFNTLGNIAIDPRVGLLFVDFDTGDCLHVTGTAQIFVGRESQTLYPHSQRAVQVSIESAVLNLHALPFRLVTKELSPYNPRTANLAAGTMLHDGITSGARESANMATLERITRHSPDVASFEFRATRGIKYRPGQYAVLDFGEFNTVGYRHMAPDAPQSLNDDYIRTWTISSAPERLDKATEKFSLTIKLKVGGRISTLLHEWTPVEGEEEKEGRRLTVPLMSVGGEFVLPSENKKLLFISGGIGATPFIAMLRGLGKQKEQASSLEYDIQWITSATAVEEALPEILREVLEVVGPQLSITLSPEIAVEMGRLDARRLHDAIPDVLSRQVLLCGPDPFMEATRGYLSELHVAPENIHSEAFNF